MKRVRVRVEGCLDGVLAKLLIEEHGVEAEIPMPRGGKRGVIRDLRRDVERGIRSIAFIDADEDAATTLSHVIEKLRDIATVKAYHEPVPHTIVERNGSVKALVILWAKPPDYRQGTIEDLICTILHDTCETLASNILAAMRALCRPSERRTYKLAPLVILAVCGEGGTLVYNPQLNRCGFDPTSTIKALNILDHNALQPYRNILHDYLQHLTDNATHLV